MSTDANRALVLRFYAEGLNRHDANAAAAFYAPDASNHGQVVGREGMRRVFEALLATFPDLRFDVIGVTAQDERVVCHLRFSGTHEGEPPLATLFGGALTGVAPTGRSVSVSQFHEFTIRDGSIDQHEAVRDDLGMLRQLGLR